MSGYRTEPDPGQPNRCPSIDPHDTLQCGRQIHDDDRCRFGGIAWVKGTPRHISDRERAEAAEAQVAALTATAARLRAAKDELVDDRAALRVQVAALSDGITRLADGAKSAHDTAKIGFDASKRRDVTFAGQMQAFAAMEQAARALLARVDAPKPDDVKGQADAVRACGATCGPTCWVQGVFKDHEHTCTDHQLDDHRCQCGASWGACCRSKEADRG
ncbi:hypothetical protein [Nocardioides jejuensis]|uniref:Uncharacterized protein n=1 Tax=Nocardioides jejuensis TaxID=2502782 RepID=A0A4R1BY93_9ACTN|nr:hypothetical protein [Nocardioides jejuensis]TCJ23040.1 hypothetical protein EPD65_11805 [Nocardioides jejuensis]